MDDNTKMKEYFKTDYNNASSNRPSRYLIKVVMGKKV